MKRFDLTNFLNIASKKKAQLPPMETKPSSEDILNAILPPREWVENGNLALGCKFSNDCYRKTLYLICESSASIKSRCCSFERNVRSKTHGKISQREWHLSS